MSGAGGAGERRSRLETDLRRALTRAGAADETVASVMGAGCRIDGVGAAAVSTELARSSERLRRRIRELAAALDRMDRGEYGRCQQCARAIDDARLDVLPTAERCRICASDA